MKAGSALSLGTTEQRQGTSGTSIRRNSHSPIWENSHCDCYLQPVLTGPTSHNYQQVLVSVHGQGQVRTHLLYTGVEYSITCSSTK